MGTYPDPTQLLLQAINSFCVYQHENSQQKMLNIALVSV